MWGAKSSVIFIFPMGDPTEDKRMPTSSSCFLISFASLIEYSTRPLPFTPRISTWWISSFFITSICFPKSISISSAKPDNRIPSHIIVSPFLISSLLPMLFGHKGIPEGCFLYDAHAFGHKGIPKGCFLIASFCVKYHAGPFFFPGFPAALIKLF